MWRLRVTDLAELGNEVEWTDHSAAAQTRSAVSRADGRLRDIAEWLAGTQHQFPPQPPKRPRWLTIGEVSPTTAAIAVDVEVTAGALELPAHAGVERALEAGVTAADVVVDSGADLLLVSGRDDSPASAVLVSVLTGAEPVSLLPRGAAAVDTSAWIARAEHLRDARRAVSDLSNRPDDLLEALNHPPLAAMVGLILRAAARRTPIVLDGAMASSAALLCYGVQARVGRWWQFADLAADPVQARVVTELIQEPILTLSTSGGSGIAALLTVPVLRAAADLVTQA